jgi:hypothetical protein
LVNIFSETKSICISEAQEQLLSQEPLRSLLHHQHSEETLVSMPESLQNQEQVLLSVLPQLLHNQVQQEQPELPQCHQQQDLKDALDTMDNN